MKTFSSGGEHKATSSVSVKHAAEPDKAKLSSIAVERKTSGCMGSLLFSLSL